MKNNRTEVHVDSQGHLILPPPLTEKPGIQPGDSLLQQNRDSFTISRPVHAIARVNIELTTQCNLSSLTCIRDTREEPVGMPRMDADLTTLQVYSDLLKSGCRTNLGSDHSGEHVDTCPFLAKGSVSMRWDGQVSPCPPSGTAPNTAISGCGCKPLIYRCA